VVGPAHQGQVGEVGGAAVQPVAQVVGFAPGQGRWQPGKTQPPSRTARAARWAAWTTRLLRPTSSGWLGAAQDRGEQGHGRLEPFGQVPFVAEAVVARVAAGVVRVIGVVVAAGVLMVVVAGGVAGDQDPGDGPVTGQPPAGLGVQGPLSVSPPGGCGPGGCPGPP
jgi:hypothetical protein